MSRVGKMPVTIPAGVDVSIKDDQISVKGSGGTLSLAQNVLVKVSSNDGKLSFEPVNDSREANAMSGTLRQLVNNMVVGVSKGFEKKQLEQGTGNGWYNILSRLKLINGEIEVDARPGSGAVFTIHLNQSAS